MTNEIRVKNNTFFRKIFGTTGKSEKEAGEKAIAAGNNLIDTVNESARIDKKTDEKLRRIKK